MSDSSPSDDENKAGESTSTAAPPREVSHINIKLPSFWPNSPSTWFIQAEAQFSLGRIKKDSNRYNYVVAALPQDVAESIVDILEAPPLTEKYEYLKKVLIERHSLSMERRIKKIITDEEMGDKKPSEFYRKLKQLAGSSGTVGVELIKKTLVRTTTEPY